MHDQEKQPNHDFNAEGRVAGRQSPGSARQPHRAGPFPLFLGAEGGIASLPVYLRPSSHPGAVGIGCPFL